MRAHVPALTGIAESLVDRLPETEAVDLVTAFARPMACASVCAVLGIPDHHASVIQECADAANSASLTKADRYEADARLRHLISAELTRMRHEVEPRGVLARLIQATGRSDADLGHPEWLTLATMLATAGLKENTSQIALSVAMLLRQGSWPATSPDLADCLDLAESCIDWLTIIQWGINRVVTSDRMVGDVAMRAGDLVVISLLLANHDRARHGDRPAPAPPGGCPVAAHDKPPRHLSFGFGPHQCLGANLARVELAVSLMVLFQRCPNLTLQNVDHGSAMSPVWAPDRVMVGWKRT
jgi:cytochrome P450